LVFEKPRFSNCPKLVYNSWRMSLKVKIPFEKYKQELFLLRMVTDVEKKKQAIVVVLNMPDKDRSGGIRENVKILMTVKRKKDNPSMSTCQYLIRNMKELRSRNETTIPSIDFPAFSLCSTVG